MTRTEEALTPGMLIRSVSANVDAQRLAGYATLELAGRRRTGDHIAMHDTLPPFDAAGYRANTPGVAAAVHLNAAGAALPSARVADAVKAHLDLEARVGLQAALAQAQDGLAQTRVRAAALLDCRPDEIAFGTTCTQLWSLMFQARRLPAGGRILVSRGEWGGNLLAVHAAAHDLGHTVETISTDGAGRIDVARLQARLDDDVRLIAVAAVSSVSGVRQPVGAIGALARPPGCLYFIDAAQMAGRFPFSLRDSRADVIVAPARKWLRGPRGQAVAALSGAALSQLTAPPLMDLAGVVWPADGEPSPRDDARRFESFEFSVAGRLGFGAALGELLDAGPAAVTATIDERVRLLRSALAACDGVTVHEPADSDAAFLTFTCADVQPSDVALALGEAGIAIANQEHRYAPLELSARGLGNVLRAAPHAYTHPDEITRFAGTLGRVIRDLRGMRRAG
jgi:cysteine desulfurase/selenocysteine lyase